MRNCLHRRQRTKADVRTYRSILGKDMIHVNRGMRKAAVFPDPVSATPMMSRLRKPMGMACRWMGVGL